MLEVYHLGFRYPGGTEIIRDVSFTAKPGEITAVIGVNGVGKTTMLKCIAGLEAGRGDIRICQRDQKSLGVAGRTRLTSYLSQNTACDANLNVYEIILLGLVDSLSFRVTPEDQEKVASVMELMSVSQFAGRKISELSGGQRQLVFIAQTLVRNPRVLIMDEPASALDLNKQFKLMNFLRDITREKQFTTLVTLHQMDLAARYADHVVVLDQGSVYGEGRPREVFTERMLREVYGVEAEIYQDRHGGRHVVALDCVF